MPWSVLYSGLQAPRLYSRVGPPPSEQLVLPLFLTLKSAAAAVEPRTAQAVRTVVKMLEMSILKMGFVGRKIVVYVE